MPGFGMTGAEHRHLQRESIQSAWNSYSWGRIDAEEFACIVATVLQLDNHPKPDSSDAASRSSTEEKP